MSGVPAWVYLLYTSWPASDILQFLLTLHILKLPNIHERSVFDINLSQHSRLMETLFLLLTGFSESELSLKSLFRGIVARHENFDKFTDNRYIDFMFVCYYQKQINISRDSINPCLYVASVAHFDS